MTNNKYRYKEQITKTRKEYEKVINQRFYILAKKYWTKEDAEMNEKLANKEIELADKIKELEELEIERAFNEDWKVLFFYFVK